MKQLLKITKSGGSLALHITKAINNERLDWKEGEYIFFEANKNGIVELSKVEVEPRKTKKEPAAAANMGPRR